MHDADDADSTHFVTKNQIISLALGKSLVRLPVTEFCVNLCSLGLWSGPSGMENHWLDQSARDEIMQNNTTVQAHRNPLLLDALVQQTSHQ